MRIKEIDRTANIAWSPVDQYPIYLATGTAAQQLDATFSTSSSVECYSLNLAEATLDMPLVASKQTECRFHKVLWGSLGIGTSDFPAGVIVTGGDNGDIQVFNADSLIKQDEDCLINKLSHHNGAVRALDLNPFQKNLLASGGGDSEIYIWDLNKTEKPMTPGQKSQPPEDVQCVAWNQQVQHILGSTLTNRCVVWDLRKNEPIIKVSDSMSRIKCKHVVWHPEVATQLMLSSEDDHTPVIQLWDLRYATSPLKVLENHQRGVLSMAWCPQDPDLLLSCGKDNRILCWNPNSNIQGGEVIYEIPTSNQWCFDVQWCPRNPSLISGSTFDGHITIYSLMGGGHPIQPSNKVAESFNTVEPFGQAPIPVPQEQEKVMPLQKPPKWLRKPVGASFAFGGKLVSFGHMKSTNPQQPVPKQVYISQVITETEIVNRSSQLEQAINNNQFLEFCAMKASNCNDNMEESIWNFLKVNFEKDPRKEFLHLLGYDETGLAEKKYTAESNISEGVDASELAQKMSQLGTGVSADGLMTQALLTGNFEAAVDMCLSQNKMAEAILLAIAGGQELLSKTQKIYFQRNKSHLGRLISSIVTHDWPHIINNCELDNWKEALAVILTYSKPEEFSPLCDALASRLESENNGQLSLYASLCYICSGNIERLVENWMRNTENNNAPMALQDLVEKVMILRKAVYLTRGSISEISTGPLADRLNQYAGLLAAQGNLFTALSYLRNANEPSLAVLLDRLYQAIGQPIQGMTQPQFPFQRVNLLPVGVRQPQQQQQEQQQIRQRQQMRGSHQAQSKIGVGYNQPPNMSGPIIPSYQESKTESAWNDPPLQMKRKLEDVCRKLEILYDKLREDTLSQNVLMGLHQIVQYIQQFDYNTCLSIQTQMISQGNFSEISAFMPGVKVLLQTASQLQVYLQ
ncbi:hypothetical protein LOTGIDRAFT_106381 [Lottia gigantea]|uniref:Uncharacterized protein n=1 Tax=Lottia gigantea TaxID=225164 RepID=V3ZXD7_LOTGI|nr:hypothetical protein LOTGIDRAFT_106381 [Lottia gigantea]ESO89042.1 hypothetical protein LOTGIDRAFT_106381 [Lottia gigantea]